ncbi:hypothetical protein TKK_0002982 [Trichogramma kaykai]
MIQLEQVNGQRRERYSKFGAGANSWNSKHRASARGDNNNSSSSESGDTKNVSKNSESLEDTQARKCNRCKQTGHLQKDCKNKLSFVCYTCVKEGHIAKNCPLNDTPIKANVNVIHDDLVKNAINSTSGEKFFKDILFNGETVKAEIDMGSEVNTVKSTTVLMHNLKIKNLRTVLSGFGESEVTSPGITCAKMKVGDLRPRVAEFRIVPDGAQRCEVIIGRPFTEALDITYKRDGYELIFADIDPSIFDDRKTPEKTRVLEDTLLQRSSINFVKVNTNAG